MHNIIVWLLGYLELLKAVVLFSLFMLLGFFIEVFILDVFIVLISAIYEAWRGRK